VLWKFLWLHLTSACDHNNRQFSERGVFLAKEILPLIIIFMKKSNIPNINIQSSYLLEDRFELPKIKEEKIKEYQKEWKKYEKNTLSAIQNITGLIFDHNIIDVYVVNPFKFGAISKPIIVGGGMSPDRFVCVLTHELIHRIMEDNIQGAHWHKKIKRMYSTETNMVSYHVAVHAILEGVLIKINNQDMLIQDIRISNKHADYKRAWEIVKKAGHQNIINRLRSF